MATSGAVAAAGSVGTWALQHGSNVVSLSPVGAASAVGMASSALLAVGAATARGRGSSAPEVPLAPYAFCGAFVGMASPCLLPGPLHAAGVGLLAGGLVLPAFDGRLPGRRRGASLAPLQKVRPPTPTRGGLLRGAALEGRGGRLGLAAALSFPLALAAAAALEAAARAAIASGWLSPAFSAPLGGHVPLGPAALAAAVGGPAESPLAAVAALACIPATAAAAAFRGSGPAPPLALGAEMAIALHTLDSALRAALAGLGGPAPVFGGEAPNDETEK